MKTAPAAAANAADIRPALIEAAIAGSIPEFDEEAAGRDGAALAGITDQLGWTALHYAAQRGHLDLVDHILDLGFPVDARDNSGATPLYRAVGFGHLPVVKLLHARGADIHALSTSIGSNMLTNGAWAGHENICAYLIKEGVAWDKVNKNGNFAISELIAKLPHMCPPLLDCRRRQVAGYLQHVQLEYNFQGLDDQDPSITTPSPFELMVTHRRLELLSHPVMQAFLEFKWDAFGRRAFLSELLVYAIVLASFTASVIGLDGVARVVCEGIVLAFAASDLVSEVLEIRGSRLQLIDVPDVVASVVRRVAPSRVKHSTRGVGNAVQVRAYFLRVWNLIDLASSVSVIAAMSLRWTNGTGRVELLSVAAFLLWIKVLQVLQVVSGSGALVTMVSEMLWRDLPQFLVIFVVYLVALALALFISIGSEGTNDWSTFPRALMTTWRITLGDIDWPAIEETGSTLGAVWFVLSTVLLTLTLLNMIIGVFSSTLGRIYYQAQDEYRLLKADLLLRTEQKMGKAAVAKIEARKRAEISARGIGAARATPGASGIRDRKDSCLYVWEHRTKAAMEAADEVMSLQVLRGELMDELQRMEARLLEAVTAAAAPSVSRGGVE